MRIISIFTTVCIAVLMFASCSKFEDVSVPTTTESKPFFIQIGRSGAMSRAVGADMSSATVTFTDGYLIFAAGNEIGQVIKIVSGSVIGAGEITVAQLEQGAVIDGIPANTKNVYLYGNLGASISGITAAAQKGGSIATIEALTWTLADVQNAANDVANVPVYGKGDVVPDTSNPNRLKSEFSVAPIGSRLQIGEISCSDTRVTKLTLGGIYINNFYHSMDANFTFKSSYLVDKSIDKSAYPATGYTDYPTMSDVITSVEIDPQGGKAAPTGGSHWAYNFLPSNMPHIILYFKEMEVDGQKLTDRYVTVANYSTSATGGSGNEVAVAKAGNVYSLKVDISDYEKQIGDLPESGSTVTGYVKVNIIDWVGNTIYPEW